MDPETAPSFFDFSYFGWPLTGLVMLFALGIYFWMTWNVGHARRKHSVPPPHTSGPDEFLRALRVQQNTLEQLALFLPLLWITALSTRDEIAALIGVMWPISRLMYALGYYKEAGKHTPGFIIGLVVCALLFLISVARMGLSLAYFMGNSGAS